MVSLSRFFHANAPNDDASAPSSPIIQGVVSGTTTSDMTQQSGSSPPALGAPGTLKAVFGTYDPRRSDVADEYVDEILPEYLQSSLASSNATMGRRSRLDESAGEGLRRNVLLRNAMLSSLERERRQLSEEMSVYSIAASSVAPPRSSSTPALDEEAQFFEDLLSELSGSDISNPATTGLETSMQQAETQFATDDAEDFVELDSGPASEQAFESLASTSFTASHGSVTALVPAIRDEAALVDSCSSAFSRTRQCDDSGFAEEASRPASAASCCYGYPNVCPYPAVRSFAGGSSEELPALIDDDDSDLDEDEDEDDEVDHQLTPSPELAVIVEAIGPRQESSALPGLQVDAATLSRPHSPLLPVVSPVQSVCADYASFRDPLSPEDSRPTSPISSASSKGDGDGPSPLLLPSDLDSLTSLAELSLQLPAAAGLDLLSRPSRARTAAWFEHKQDGPLASGAGASAERMRWTTSPATYFRPLSVASSSTVSEYHSHRLGVNPDHGGCPLVAPNDPAEHSVVVHWSR